MTELEPGRVEEEDLVAAARVGDEAAFGQLVERYRPELQVHCYRMLGSFSEAEDLVQEAFLRAWRGRETYQGRATFRAWLYRIATNACLDFLRQHPRQPVPHKVAAGPGTGAAVPTAEIPWLQPYPDRLLDQVAPAADQPDAVVIARETIELAFLAAVQHLPPRQRAVLILRDVLGWPASDTAALIEGSVAAVNSALQRARATLQEHLPRRRDEWAPSTAPSEDERAVVRRYMAASERADMQALAGLLAEDALQTMPPEPIWFSGREAILSAWASVASEPDAWGEFRVLQTSANRQPAVANYLRRPGERDFAAFNLDVLRIDGGQVVEVTSFAPTLFPLFGLPPALAER